MSKISVMIDKKIWDKYWEQIAQYCSTDCTPEDINHLTDISINISLEKFLELD